MCIAAPGKVVEVKGRKALVQYPGEEIRQAIIANEKVKVGSYVLVQMGIIIDVLSKSQAKQAASAWR
jgi:hydrogenase expression/formation protein HypC